MTQNQLISLLNEDLANERMHLAFYLYHASAVAGLHAPEYRELLLDAAKSELGHVLAFQDRIFGLDGDVGLAVNEYPRLLHPQDILRYAVAIEERVVANYSARLKQLEAADFPAAAYMKVFYEDQIQDSYEDGEKLRRALLGAI